MTNPRPCLDSLLVSYSSCEHHSISMLLKRKLLLIIHFIGTSHSSHLLPTDLLHRRVECNTEIIAASIPSMKSLFKFLIDKTLYSVSQSMKKGYYLRQESAHSLTTFGGGHGGTGWSHGEAVLQEREIEGRV